MSKYIPGNQKHLTLNDRIYIENELSKGATFTITLMNERVNIYCAGLNSTAL